MMKNYLSLLALMLATNAHAVAFKVDGINYSTTSATTVKVLPYSSGSGEGISLNNGYQGDVVIPEKITYEGVDYTVTAVEEETFSFSNKLTSVSLPATVQSLGEAPFASCNRLTAIHVDEASPYFKTIDGVLFDHDVSVILACPASMTGTYNVPSTVREVGHSAFYGCTRLTDITLPDGVMVIGESAFRSCTKLQSFRIPKGVTEIKNHMLRNCASLQSVFIPEGVTRIGNYAFSYCQSMGEITIPSTVKTVGTRAFDNCHGLRDIQFPEGVTSLGNDVMMSCSALQTASLPASLQHIGTGMFRVCMSLRQINLAADNPYFVCEQGVLLDADKTRVICCPAASSGEYTVPATVTAIDDFAFYYCQNLTAIHLPAHLQSIGMAAFAYCAALQSFVIPAEVGFIGLSAFYYCDQLAAVVCQGTVPPVIEQEAFTAYGSITLYAPAQSRQQYAQADFWKKFTRFKGIGDVNLDGRVNVADVMALVNVVLGSSTIDVEQKVCDINYDSNVNVTDVMGVVRICLEN